MQWAKLWFMAGKLRNDLLAWMRPVPVFAGPYGTELRYYYLRFQEDPKRLNRLIAGFDEQGIPLNTTYVDVETPRLHYYPISIGQYALAVFHSWLDTGNPDKKAHFMRIADWFVAQRSEDPQLGVYWLTDIPKPEYGVYQPWKSAFSQSRGLSVLLRAWQLSNDDHYLQIAVKALQPYAYDISRGGVSVDRDQGAAFYEEYVAQQPTRVLDGHLFSLFGLFDFVRAVRPEQAPEAHALARRLFEEGTEGLKRQLPLFDLGFWLRFNRCDLPGYPNDDPCTISYLKLVSAQLGLLYRLSGDPFFQQESTRLSHYLKPAHVLRMYRMKSRALQKLNRL